MTQHFNPDLNFEQLAEIATEKAGGNSDKAKTMLVEWGMGQDAFILKNKETFLTRRFTDAVSHLAKDKRKTLKNTPEDIFDFPLWGGSPLGNVSIKEVSEAGNRWKQDASTRANKAAFCLEIATCAQRMGLDLTSKGAVRLIPKEDMAMIFAKHFGDGTVQPEFEWLA